MPRPVRPPRAAPAAGAVRTGLRACVPAAALALLAACAQQDAPTPPGSDDRSETPAVPTSSATPVPEPRPETPLLAALDPEAAPDAADARAQVRVLLARGADTRATDDEGRTARERAEALGLDGVARLLARADEPVDEPAAALLSAASRGDADTAALALRAGAPLEARDARRRTPLLLAVIDDGLEVSALLARLGADPDAVDVQRDTPWLVTGVTGSVQMAKLLLPLDPDVTLRNRYGGVSIIPASERGHVAYVRWALQHTDVDVDHVNDLGWTALMEAVVLGEGTERWQRIVEVLLAHGADRTIPDRDGVTALAHARSRGYDEIAALLAG